MRKGRKGNEEEEERTPLLGDKRINTSKGGKGGYVVLERVQVRVHVIEGRSLQPRDSNGGCDPVCVVECFGKKRSTNTLNNTSLAHWDRLFVFEKEGEIFQKEVERECIRISVFDANTIKRDVLVGSFEFVIGGIRRDSIKRRWIGLWGPSPQEDNQGKLDDKREGIQGYLKVSLDVLYDLEESNIEGDEEGDEDNDFSSTDIKSMVLLPPDVESGFKVIKLHLFKAEGLPKMDTMGSVDPYVAVKFPGNPELKTKIIKKDKNPTFNQTVVLTAHSPIFSDQLTLQLRDWDAGPTKDDIIATYDINISKIEAEPATWRTPRWINYYGCSGSEEANKGLIQGSYWRGRLLASCTVSDSSNTQASTKKEKKSKGALAIKPVVMDIQESVGNPPSVIPFEFSACLLELAFLPKGTSGSICIHFSMGSKEIGASKKIKAKNLCAQFPEPVFLTSTVQLEDDPSQWAKLVLEVKANKKLSSSKRFSFALIDPIDHVLDSNNYLTKYKKDSGDAGIRWFSLNSEEAHDKHGFESSSAGSGGYFCGAIRFQRHGAPGRLEDLIDSKKVGIKKKRQLRAFIYQGRNFRSGDRDGGSDPYLVLRLGTHQAKTEVRKCTLFPIWNEVLVVDCLIREGSSPIVSLFAYDWDKIGKDDFLGSVDFEVSESKASDQIPKPTWIQLGALSRFGRTDAGEILASFQLIDAEDSIPIPKSIAPNAIECDVRISVVGLRDMSHYNLLPINAPYLKFDCGGCENEPVSTKKCDKPSGSNTLHLEIVDLKVSMPKDPLFAPPLNIKVYDDRKISRPLIATRSIDLGEYLPWIDVDSAPSDSKEQRRFVAPPENIEAGAEDLDEEEPADIGEETERQLEEQAGGDVMQIRDKLIESLASAQGRVTNIKETALGVFDGAGEEEKAEAPKRPVIEKELESVIEVPYSIYTLHRAKKMVSVPVGKMKAKVKVLEPNDKLVGDSGKEKETSRLITMLEPRKLIVRVYVLEAFQLVPGDDDGTIDAYLKVKLKGLEKKSKQVLESKKNEIVSQNALRPQFFQSFEFKADFPAQTKLSVQVWDYDKLSPDDLVGKTKIDLETRFTSAEWHGYGPLKPIEWRTLKNPSSSHSQGHLKMWVDILAPSEAEKHPLENISPRKAIEMEMRVIVWSTKNVVFKDKNMSDIIVSCFPIGQKPQVTDTHWRSEDGKGEFNWRMKFPMKLPNKSPLFHIQLWDKDLLSPDDVIGEAVINLKGFCNAALRKSQEEERPDPVKLDKQWLSLYDISGENLQGEVALSFELLTTEEAMRRDAGFGRSQPNEFPHLPDPVRPETSINPFRIDKMIWKVLLKRHKWKIIIPLALICCVLVTLACLYIYLMIPKF